MHHTCIFLNLIKNHKVTPDHSCILFLLIDLLFATKNIRAPNIKRVLPYVPNSTHLRWVCEKVVRDMFMDPSSVTDATLNGKSFFDLESVREDVAPKETPNKDSIDSIRLMFIGK